MAKQVFRKRSDRGLTILEAVMVLAVVGLIVGAIWAGYKTLNSETKITNGTRQLTMLLATTREYLAKYNENNVFQQISGTNVTQLLLNPYFTATNTVVIPSDIKLATNGDLQTDLGAVSVWLYSGPASGTFNSPRIILSYSNLPQGLCMNLIEAVAGNATSVQNLGLLDIQMTSTYSITGTGIFPANETFIRVETARTSCASANANNISFAFNLRG